MIPLRASGLAFLAFASVVACGSSNTGSADAKSAQIKSMPPYPDAKASTKAAEPTAEPAKPTDPKEICKGAHEVKTTSVDAKPPRGLFDDDKVGFGGATSSLKAKGKEYSMADLQALEKKGAWEELLGHAEDIAPAQRGAAWEKTVEKAAIGYMEQLTTNTAAFEGVFTSQSLLKRFPHLLKSEAFMAKRGEAGKTASEICLRESYRGTRCIEMMKDFLKTDATSPDVGFAFGKIARKNQNHYVAVPFFKWALDKQTNAAMCGDEDLRMAVVAGLGLPPDYENAGGARAIATNKCWDGLAAAIKKELVESPGGYYRDNACAVLKAKGAL